MDTENNTESIADEAVEVSLTPLGMAMEAGSSEAFDVLLRECNAGVEVGDVEGDLTPLHFAAEKGLVGW